MIDLHALSDFVLVATHGGITQAARASRRPKASLSRRVMELEAYLGVRLLDRGSRSVRLTEYGETLFSRTAGPLSEIYETAELLRDGRAQPRGRLRINLPSVFGQLLLGRLAAEFTIAYPEVQLDVTMEDRKIDPLAEGYDIVVRVNPRPDTALVGRRFARDRLVMVASPQLPMPTGAIGETVPIVVRSRINSDAVWSLAGLNSQDVPTRIVLTLPTFPTVRDAVLTGIGAARLPNMLISDDLAAGRLVSWGDVPGGEAELWALHTSSRLPSAKVKVFMAYLETAFPGGWL
ncbi:LysR family transcriptional regulator [Sphingobium sp.]|uniref:LysR family transcriptional regulator n=1 Tax=Sphingobium sp. TaxID=1912891 RepID=UPI003BB5048C